MSDLTRPNLPFFLGKRGLLWSLWEEEEEVMQNSFEQRRLMQKHYTGSM